MTHRRTPVFNRDGEALFLLKNYYSRMKRENFFFKVTFFSEVEQNLPLSFVPPCSCCPDLFCHLAAVTSVCLRAWVGEAGSALFSCQLARRALKTSAL